MSELQRIGILHPGEMGVFVAATVQNSGFEVYWASEGRSEASRVRAAEHNLSDAGALSHLCDTCDAIVSVCPPHAAEGLAHEVVECNFRGLFIDANAISPQKAWRIGDAMSAAGIAFVDGGIIGGPAWRDGSAWLSLSGQQAEQAATLFTEGPLHVDVLGAEIGKASALKMAFSARAKGTAALTLAVMGAAESLGVREALERQWQRYDDTEPATTHTLLQRISKKAWRFAGEMDEVAETFGDAGQPDNFHQGASEMYSRLADFKDMPEVPSVKEVLEALQSLDAD